MIYVPKMTLLEKSKICRTFRAVGHLGTLQSTASVTFSGHASRQVMRAKDGQGRAHSNSQRTQRSLSRSVSRSRDRQSGQSQRDGNVGCSNTGCTSVTGGAQN